MHFSSRIDSQTRAMNMAVLVMMNVAVLADENTFDWLGGRDGFSHHIDQMGKHLAMGIYPNLEAKVTSQDTFMSARDTGQ